MRKTLTVYCSGSPNFFIYGVTKDGDTYSLIDNQYWIPSSKDLTQPEKDRMFVMVTEQFNVQD